MVVVSPLWRGPGSIHGFILDGKSYRQGWATAQTPTVPAEFGVDISRISGLLVLCQNPFRKHRLEPEAFVSSPCEGAMPNQQQQLAPLVAHT